MVSSCASLARDRGIVAFLQVRPVATVLRSDHFPIRRHADFAWQAEQLQRIIKVTVEVSMVLNNDWLSGLRIS